MSFIAAISVPITRASARRRLLRDLLSLAGDGAAILSAASEPWASALFEGTRHLVDIGFSGEGASAQADAAAKILPEAEFTIRGHIVADISIDGRRDAMDDSGAPFVLLRLSALTIEDW